MPLAYCDACGLTEVIDGRRRPGMLPLCSRCGRYMMLFWGPTALRFLRDLQISVSAADDPTGPRG